MMRILLEAALGLGDADQAQQLDRAPHRRLPADAEMAPHPFGELRADRQQRVERGHRLLEDHRDLAAADRPDLILAERQQVAAGEVDAALDAAGRGWHEPEDGERADRLAAAGFADHRDGLALGDVIGDPADRPDEAVRAPEIDPEVLDLEQLSHATSLRLASYAENPARTPGAESASPRPCRSESPARSSRTAPRA